MLPKRLLLVEDDRALAELVSFHFDRAGYAVTRTGDGEEALILAEEVRPDAAHADVVRAIGSRAIASAVVLRLARLVCREQGISLAPIMFEVVSAAMGDIGAFPEIIRVEYVSPDSALARARAELGEFKDVFESAFLPASIDVRLRDGSIGGRLFRSGGNNHDW